MERVSDLVGLAARTLHKIDQITPAQGLPEIHKKYQYFSGTNTSIVIADVRNIINSVVDALDANEQRTFTYIEQAFFQRFYRELSDERKKIVQRLVKNKQLTFANGGWCMHDEAAPFGMHGQHSKPLDAVAALARLLAARIVPEDNVAGAHFVG